jgi:hypothetical protein
MKKMTPSVPRILVLLIFLKITGCSFSDSTVFEPVSSETSGIFFQNTVSETDEQNMLSFEYMYNGAGVAAADFNNDGLTDLYFAGNETGNALYLNRGDFQFQDISAQSGTSGSSEKWYSGVSAVDINSDGLMDIYLSVSGRDDAELRKNELYINSGPDDAGIPVFEEFAQEYGLDDPSYSTHAAFFDYNNDGTLDMYLLVANSGSGASYANAFEQMGQQNEGNTDKLFEGAWDDQLNHPVYRDVSETSGINLEGYGLGVNILDVNMDGHKDIYVTNDYVSEDLFWVNNGDGTFTNRLADMLSHTSYSAMGSDVADINNDGLLDLFSLDMLPEVNVRAKMMANPSNYRNYVNEAFADMFPQHTKNTLQLNMGSVNSNELPVFSEIAAFANVEATDWSWASLFADFNNSGFRDLFITNGIPRDITDKDFWSEYGRVQDIMPMSMALPKIPQVPATNYIFENNHDLTFTNRSEQWGFVQPGYSTGTVYADLDNDGDLDIVVNNSNSTAGLYRNNTVESGNEAGANWLKIKLFGTERNRNGLGTVLDLFFDDGSRQKHEQSVYRGYLSSVDPVLHFGIGRRASIDSLRVSYTLGRNYFEKTFYGVEANQVLDINLNEFETKNVEIDRINGDPEYKWVTEDLIPDGEFESSGYNDFADNPMLLYKLSELGPASASGDITGNGLEDLFVGPVGSQEGYLLKQQQSGEFVREPFLSEWATENPGIVVNDAELTDVNGDGYPDLYLAVASLSRDLEPMLAADRLYLNDGAGGFEFAENMLPEITTNSNSITSADINSDGQPDFFIGSGAGTGTYPVSDRHYFLVNDLQNSGSFIDQTEELSATLASYDGIINDSEWIDLNGSGTPELITAGDWEPVRVFQKEGDMWVDKTSDYGLNENTGLWMSISVNDINSDGFPDLIAGNFGENALFKADKDQPMHIYFGDLTSDGFFESIPSRFTVTQDGEIKEFPYHYREDFMRHIPGLMRTYSTHEGYGRTTMQEIIAQFEGKIEEKELNNLQSVMYINEAGKEFSLKTLPGQAQFAPLFDAFFESNSTESADHLFITGNMRGGDVYSSSYNAMKLFVMDVKTEIEPLSINTIPVSESGIRLNGYARSIYKIINRLGASRFAVVFDTGEVQIFERL